MYTSFRTELRQLLLEKSDPKAKEWWEGYVKESAPFFGVKMGNVRAIMHHWYGEVVVKVLDYEQQLDLALALFQGDYTEEKLAGTLFLQEILLPIDAVRCERDLDRFAELFIQGYIYDWNVCDWFCVKVLGPIVKKEGERCAIGISEWKSAENLWQARASLVAFVPVAENAGYYGLIENSCQVVIRRQERFAKTAVGWILRDISKHDPMFVKNAVTENIAHFSIESLKNATKYFTKEEKRIYLQMLKDA